MADMTGQLKRQRVKLYLGLYPFTVTALAINLFLVGLLWQATGLPALRPFTALLASIPLGILANFLVLRWVLRLLEEARE